MHKYVFVFLILLKSINVLCQDIKILSPKSGKTYFNGDQILITWEDNSNTPLGNANILITYDGNKWDIIGTNIVPQKKKGLYHWVIPVNISSKQSRIRIQTLYGNNKNFDMDGSFEIIGRTMGAEEQKIKTRFPIMSSQGFVKRDSIYLYLCSFNFEPTFYFNDNNIGIGGIVGTIYSNPKWELQGGPLFKIRIFRDGLKFENIILIRTYITTSFLFSTRNRKSFEAGLSAETSFFNIIIRGGREINLKENYFLCGLGFNLDWFFLNILL